MDIKGRVKTKTKIYKNILDKASGREAAVGDTLHITGIKPYGIRTYYELNDGSLIEGKYVSILRDNDFYYSNYKSNTLQKNNLALIGARGLSDALDELSKDKTDMYFDLQRFAITGDFVTVGGGFMGGSNSSSNYGYGSAGGYSGGIISTANPSEASDTIGSMEINNIGGIDSGSTAGQLLSGVTVGSLFDGSFLETVAGNLFDMIGGLFSNKMKFVIGFSFAAGRGGSNFGSKWASRGVRNSNGSNGAGNRQPQWTGWVGDTVARPNVQITYYGTGGSVIQRYNQRQLPNNPMNRNFERYFSYYVPLEGELVSSRTISTVAASRYGFFEDYHTGTATPKRPSIETEFFRSMTNADYSEVKSAIDVVREEFNLHIDRDTIFKKFNRFRVPTPDNELTHTRGHIFFTRPDLNLNMEKEVGGQGTRTRILSAAHATPFIQNMMKAHPVLTSYMMGSKGPGGDNMIPILSHCCTGLDVSDEILETVEAHESFTGWKVIYGKSNVKSRTAGNISVAFTDDNMLSVYKILKIWTEYISSVYRGEVTPYSKYNDRHILDYAISIYYFLCKEDDEDILFWTKYTGCFPTSAPASNFSDTIDKQIQRPSYTVQFSFAKKDDYNPIDIYEFNQLTRGLGYTYLPTYNEKTFHVHKSFVGAPFVDTMDGTHLFKLRFRPGN